MKSRDGSVRSSLYSPYRFGMSACLFIYSVCLRAQNVSFHINSQIFSILSVLSHSIILLLSIASASRTLAFLSRPLLNFTFRVWLHFSTPVFRFGGKLHSPPPAAGSPANSLDDSSNYTLMKLGTILNVSLKIASRDFVEKSTNQLEGFLNVVDLTTFQQFKELVFDT